MPTFLCVGKVGLFRELNPGPPAPEAGIIPLDQTANCVAYTLLRGCVWFVVVVIVVGIVVVVDVVVVLVVVAVVLQQTPVASSTHLALGAFGGS